MSFILPSNNRSQPSLCCFSSLFCLFPRFSWPGCPALEMAVGLMLRAFQCVSGQVQPRMVPAQSGKCRCYRNKLEGWKEDLNWLVGGFPVSGLY